MYTFFENEFKATREFKKLNELTWTSWSTLEPDDAIEVISEAGDRVGISLHPGNGYIQSNGFNVRVFSKDRGCDLTVYIWVMTDDSYLFLSLWALMQNKKTVKGGQYKREFEALFRKFNFKKINNSSVDTIKDYMQDKPTFIPLKIPWEHMEGATDDEINLVRIWCTQKEKGKDLSNKTTYESPSNVLNRLRKKYPDANIPNGAIERKKFNEQYLQQKIDSKRVRSVKKTD